MEESSSAQNFEQLCPYEERTGNCLAKDLCPFKHALNVNAKKFIPGTKSQVKKTEPSYAHVYYQPQPLAEYEDDIEEFDQPTYFEEFKTCDCCQGRVYSCDGKVCQDMGQCKCKTTAELEAEGNL